MVDNDDDSNAEENQHSVISSKAIASTRKRIMLFLFLMVYFPLSGFLAHQIH